MTLHTSNKYNPHVSVDCAIFGFNDEGLNILLIKRKQQNSVMALPGDLIKDDENLDMAANRVLFELTELENIFLEQLHAFGDPDRVKNMDDEQWLREVREEPGARVITIAYYAVINAKDFAPKPSSFADEVIWKPVYELPQLAFDHNLIVDRALYYLRNNLMREPLITSGLLPEKFTLRELQNLYEAVLNESIDKRNFRKKVLASKLLIGLNEKEVGVAHKPAQYYKFDLEKVKYSSWI